MPNKVLYVGYVCTIDNINISFIELTSQLEVIEWGHCLPDCPSQEINPVCLMDPTPPALEDDDHDSKNYTSDYTLGIGTVTKGV